MVVPMPASSASALSANASCGRQRLGDRGADRDLALELTLVGHVLDGPDQSQRPRTGILDRGEGGASARRS